MSYILDAIKKAEDQRRQEQVPTLDSIVAQGIKPRSRFNFRGLLTWTGLLLVVAVAVWFRQPITDAVGAGYTRIVQALHSVGSRIEQVVQDRTEPSPETETVAKETGQITEPPASVPVAATAPAIAANKPRIPQTTRKALERISFTVISYSADPDRRFVMDGSRVLREGDYIEEFQIAHIKREGVVLDVNGEDYLVRPRSGTKTRIKGLGELKGLAN